MANVVRLDQLVFRRIIKKVKNKNVHEHLSTIPLLFLSQKQIEKNFSFPTYCDTKVMVTLNRDKLV